MAGIVRRGGQWIYRRRVPQRLRSIIGSREIGDALGAYAKYNASKPTNPTPATRRTMPVDSNW